eukprot:COSAG05_NODE_1696_length_4261_cov_2.865596_3_plen_65_part_00
MVGTQRFVCVREPSAAGSIAIPSTIDGVGLQLIYTGNPSRLVYPTWMPHLYARGIQDRSIWGRG